MDKQYKELNNLVDEVLGVFYIVIPMFILGSALFVFKDEILEKLFHFSFYIFQYSF